MHRLLCAEVETAQVAIDAAEHRLPAHRCYEHRLLQALSSSTESISSSTASIFELQEAPRRPQESPKKARSWRIGALSGLQNVMEMDTPI